MSEFELIPELRIFVNNTKDVYMKAKLSVGDKFVTVKMSDGVTVIYPTCNVTKIIIGDRKV